MVNAPAIAALQGRSARHPSLERLTLAKHHPECDAAIVRIGTDAVSEGHRAACGSSGGASLDIAAVLMDSWIDEDAGGHLLVYAADDGSVYGDTWRTTLEEAEQVAEELFELRANDWDASHPGDAG